MRAIAGWGRARVVWERVKVAVRARVVVSARCKEDKQHRISLKQGLREDPAPRD